jgi:hypothetical protein
VLAAIGALVVWLARRDRGDTGGGDGDGTDGGGSPQHAA